MWFLVSSVALWEIEFDTSELEQDQNWCVRVPVCCLHVSHKGEVLGYMARSLALEWWSLWTTLNCIKECLEFIELLWILSRIPSQSDAEISMLSSRSQSFFNFTVDTPSWARRLHVDTLKPSFSTKETFEGFLSTFHPPCPPSHWRSSPQIYYSIEYKKC